MADLILRPSTIDPKNSFALQLRFHESLGETEYYTLCRISAGVADDIVRAGAPYFMFDEPEDKGANLKDEITQLRARCEKAEAALERLASMEGMTGSFYRKDNAEGLELLARLKFAEAAIRALIPEREG